MTEKERILQIANELGLRLSKDQGQCILIDGNIADYIIEEADLDKNSDNILEIGPGFGILTSKLLEKSKELSAVEQDEKLCGYLKDQFKEKRNFNLFCADALKIVLPKCNKVVSNLPYQISGPIIEKFILMDPMPDELILMLQLEFIERLVSAPDPKDYSRISALAQTYFTTEMLRKVPPNHFFPQPKVHSGVVRLKVNPELPEYLKPIHMRKMYIEFLGGIFPYKNKTLKNALVHFVENIPKTPENWSEDTKAIFGSRKLEISVIVEIFAKQKDKERLREFTPMEIAELFQLMLE